MTNGARVWGEIELELEVKDWLGSLAKRDFSQAMAHIDLLAREGNHLSEPHSRQLRGRLRELRFFVNGSPHRITYFVQSGRRIILLTVFRKTKQRERAEIDRAERAMRRCIAEGHTAEEDLP